MTINGKLYVIVTERTLDKLTAQQFFIYNHMDHPPLNHQRISRTYITNVSSSKITRFTATLNIGEIPLVKRKEIYVRLVLCL